MRRKSSTVCMFVWMLLSVCAVSAGVAGGFCDTFPVFVFTLPAGVSTVPTGVPVVGVVAGVSTGAVAGGRKALGREPDESDDGSYVNP